MNTPDRKVWAMGDEAVSKRFPKSFFLKKATQMIVKLDKLVHGNMVSKSRKQ